MNTTLIQPLKTTAGTVELLMFVLFITACAFMASVVSKQMLEVLSKYTKGTIYDDLRYNVLSFVSFVHSLTYVGFFISYVLMLLIIYHHVYLT